MEKIEEKAKTEKCTDIKCPFHGKLALRGRRFEGIVKKKIDKRVLIEIERFVYYRKYERYAKKWTRLHAHLPSCLANKVNIGDTIEIMECRPLSKIIHHVVVSVKKSKTNKTNKK